MGICPVLQQLLTLIVYSSLLPDISEVNRINQSYYIPHKVWMTPKKVLYFGWLLDDMTGVLSNGAVFCRCVLMQDK